MNPLIFIFLIHGLGGTTTSLKPLESYLKYIGYKNTYMINYPSRTVDLDTSINFVNTEMRKVFLDKQPRKVPEIILIGQSLGGIICHEMHRYGWNITKSITVGSPHGGSSFLKYIKSITPTNIAKYFEKPVFNDLLIQTPTIPTHKHYTISTSFAPFIPFDGQVWVNETKDYASEHTHIHFNNHWTIFIDPRLFMTISRILET